MMTAEINGPLEDQSVAFVVKISPLNPKNLKFSLPLKLKFKFLLTVATMKNCPG